MFLPHQAQSSHSTCPSFPVKNLLNSLQKKDFFIECTLSLSLAPNWVLFFRYMVHSHQKEEIPLNTTMRPHKTNGKNQIRLQFGFSHWMNTSLFPTRTQKSTPLNTSTFIGISQLATKISALTGLFFLASRTLVPSRTNFSHPPPSRTKELNFKPLAPRQLTFKPLAPHLAPRTQLQTSHSEIFEQSRPPIFVCFVTTQKTHTRTNLSALQKDFLLPGCCFVEMRVRPLPSLSVSQLITQCQEVRWLTQSPPLPYGVRCLHESPPLFFCCAAATTRVRWLNDPAPFLCRPSLSHSCLHGFVLDQPVLSLFSPNDPPKIANFFSKQKKLNPVCVFCD